MWKSLAGFKYLTTHSLHNNLFAWHLKNRRWLKKRNKSEMVRTFKLAFVSTSSFNPIRMLVVLYSRKAGAGLSSLSNRLNLVTAFPKLNIYQKLNLKIKLFNNLPQEIINMQTKTFKKHITSFLLKPWFYGIELTWEI